jgi:2-phospho-L-lactate guanylyltransferase
MTYESGTLADAVAWTVVIPVKLLHTAKTRLAPVADEDRAAFALAMALDTAAAALASPVVGAVVVVTDDPVARTAAVDLGAVVVPDAPASGLNEALSHGATEAAARWPDAGVASLASDVPALTPGELATALAEAGADGRAVVADATREGTVLLTAGPGIDLRPGYGPGSLARHRADGAVEIAAPLPGLRRDVDTVADLRAALALGCGARTAELAAARGIGAAHQATVSNHDADRGSGSVVLDNGALLTYDAAVFGSSGLLLLRAGQRVRVEIPVGAGESVSRITLATLPFTDET